MVVPYLSKHEICCIDCWEEGVPCRPLTGKSSREGQIIGTELELRGRRVTGEIVVHCRSERYLEESLMLCQMSASSVITGAENTSYIPDKYTVKHLVHSSTLEDKIIFTLFVFLLTRPSWAKSVVHWTGFCFDGTISYIFQ